MPISTADLLVFMTAALSLNLTPGNDMMYVLGQSLKGGSKTGVAASFGIAVGSLIHLGFVALGVAVILAQHPIAFDIIRYGGRWLPAVDRLFDFDHAAVNTQSRCQAAQHIRCVSRRRDGQCIQSQDHCFHVCILAAICAS